MAQRCGICSLSGHNGIEWAGAPCNCNHEFFSTRYSQWVRWRGPRAFGRAPKDPNITGRQFRETPIWKGFLEFFPKRKKQLDIKSCGPDAATLASSSWEANASLE
jgi:hypothetical protein